MARPNMKIRGRVAIDTMDLKTGSSQGLIFGSYSTSSNLLTANSTGLIVAGGVRVSDKANAVLTGNTTGLVVSGAVRVSNKQYISANSTGFIFTAAATKPAARSSSKWAFITNSTGVNSLAINTTGTTWKYVFMTSVLNSNAGYP